MSTDELGFRLRDLEAKAAIRRALGEYFAAVQQRDWATVAGVFAASADLDYGTPGVRGVSDNIRLLRAGVEKLTAASTLLGMHCAVGIVGSQARSHTSGLTAHTPVEGSAARMSAVTYEDEWLLQSDAEWRIVRRVCHHEFKGWLRLRREDCGAEI